MTFFSQTIDVEDTKRKIMHLVTSTESLQSLQSLEFLSAEAGFSQCSLANALMQAINRHLLSLKESKVRFVHTASNPLLV